MTQSYNQADTPRRDAADAADAAGVYGTEMSLDLLRWRSALSRAPDVPDLLDQVQLLRFCHDAGLASSTRMLNHVICLQLGFSAGSRARHTDLTHFAFKPDLARSLPAATGGARGTVERAIDELQLFADNAATRLAEQLRIRSRSESAGSPLQSRKLGSFGESLPVVVAELFAFLDNSLLQDGLEKADDTLAMISQWSSGLGKVDYRLFAAAPLPLLAAATVATCLQEYLALNDDFIFGPLGSAALLHAVARFDDSGLGPYFSNLPRLARNSRDVFEMGQIAQAAGHPASAGITREHWVVLLCTRLTGALRDEVIDDLGDLGATAALAAIFDRVARQPDYRADVSLIMRIRDAALDNADYDLGARAQGLLARLFPGNLLELRLLGEIYATAGLTGVAEQIFSQCLSATRDDALIQERLTALRAGKFAKYRILHGFGTPPERLRTRLLRRGGAIQ